VIDGEGGRRDDPVLTTWLRERIGARGPIPFVEFMQAVLYHPMHGYYCRPEATTGPAGDFYTSPDVHPAFGLLMSRQIAEIAAETSGGARFFHVIEAGPGTGKLARDIIEGLSLENPELARRVIYTLVEVSPSLRRAQEARLAGTENTIAGISWASWHDVLEHAGELSREGEFHGCVVANEFLDALPVHMVERRGDGLLEVHVAVDGERLHEVLLPPATGRLEEHLRGLGLDLAEGQRAEIGLSALDWVSSLQRVFRTKAGEGRGGAVIVDYGYPARELYDSVRHRGTLMCYSGHRAGDDPYARVGRQDMAAHVDFTSVQRRAQAAGFDASPVVTQLKFLVSLGLARMFADLAAAPGAGATATEGVRDRLALHQLMAPGGMGEVFKVVLLTRGTSASDLTGAKDPFTQVAGMTR